MSLDKHDNRRAMVLADVNSIGDFYTYASMLHEPLVSRIIQVIREYFSSGSKSQTQVIRGSNHKWRCSAFGLCRSR